MSFGSRLKEARKHKGLKQKELAELIGVTQSAVGNYENEISSPKEDVMYKLFEALDVSPNFLFQDSFDFEITLNETPSSTNIQARQQKTIDRYLALTAKEKVDDYVDLIYEKEFPDKR